MAETTPTTPAAPPTQPAAGGQPPANPPVTTTAAPPAPEPKPGGMSAFAASRLRRPVVKGSEAAPDAATPPEGTPPAAPAKTAAKPDAAAAPAAGTAPVKRTIRRAAGYEPAAVDKLTEVANKLTDVVSRVGQPAAPAAPPAAAPKIELTDEEQEHLEVIEAMSEMDPTKYGDLAKNTRRYIQELPEWQTKWEQDFAAEWTKKNGKRFDDDEERDAALAKARDAEFESALEDRRKKYGVNYSERDFKKAERHITTRPLEEKLERAERELQRLSQDKTQRDTEPKAKETADLAVADIAANLKGQLGEEFDGLLDDNGALVPEKAEALPDGPLLQPILEGVTKQAREFAEAAVIAFNGGQTPLAGEVARFCIWAEQKKLQSEDLLDDKGRTFVSRADYMKMKPAEQAKHWIMDAETAITMRNDEFLGLAKTQITEARKVGEKLLERHGVKLGKPRTAAPEGGTAPAKAPSNGNGKPAIATSTDGGAPGGKPAANGGNSFMKSRLSQPIIVGGREQ